VIASVGTSLTTEHTEHTEGVLRAFQRIRCVRWLKIGLRLHLLVALLNLTLLAGCACPDLAAPPTREEREASFEPLASATVRGEPLRRFLQWRSVCLVAGDSSLLGKPATSEPVEIGTAAAIASDGYFLTAAHCVARAPVVLGIATAAHPEGQWAEARVVWRGSPAVNDLALLKVEAPVDHVFEWGTGSLVPGEAVVSVGFAGSDRTLAAPGHRFAFGVAGGHFLGKVALTYGEKTEVQGFWHRSPVWKGDSGGPVATRSGRLEGINVMGALTANERGRSLAIVPDRAGIEAIMANDRAQR
jgi:S1-C subfamily serine protease